MLFSFALDLCALRIFRLFFLILFVSLIWHAPPESEANHHYQHPPTQHTMCGNNFSIIVKFCFIFLPALLLGIPSIFVWHSWLFTSPAAKMQFMVESEFRFASFYFRLIFACLCFFFQFFFIFCGLILFGMVVWGYWQLSFLCDLRLSFWVKRVIFLLHLANGDLIFEGSGETQILVVHKICVWRVICFIIFIKFNIFLRLNSLDIKIRYNLCLVFNA